MIWLLDLAHANHCIFKWRAYHQYCIGCKFLMYHLLQTCNDSVFGTSNTNLSSHHFSRMTIFITFFALIGFIIDSISETTRSELTTYEKKLYQLKLVVLPPHANNIINFSFLAKCSPVGWLIATYNNQDSWRLVRNIVNKPLICQWQTKIL